MDVILQNSIVAMTKAITGILSGSDPSVYLYGSVPLSDFRPGWSDIDLLVLTGKHITPAQAEELLHLRQKLSASVLYARLFEGGMLPLSAFLSGAPDTVVYWGTSGERITDRFAFDSFCTLELKDHAVLLYGKDVRSLVPRPAYADLYADVERHLRSIREYGGQTGESLYSFGWLLDLSRCMYTLRTGLVAAKTGAGEWALQNGLCPVPEALETALRVRKTPELFRSDAAVRGSAAHLNAAVQSYADVLEAELKHHLHRVFGQCDESMIYFDRPGAYLFACQNGKIAVVQTQKGLFLPGGGLEPGESDETCILREAAEETGCKARVGKFLCSAETYSVHERIGPFHPVQSYYTGSLDDIPGEPSEPGHRLVWLTPEEYRRNMYLEMQKWVLDVFMGQKKAE